MNGQAEMRKGRHMERQGVWARLSSGGHRVSLLALSSVMLTVALAACATAGAGTGNRHFPVIGHKGYVTCSDPGQPACMPTLDWTHVRSTAPADIIAAIESDPDYIAPPE